jgi:hypothetical protein
MSDFESRAQRAGAAAREEARARLARLEAPVTDSVTHRRRPRLLVAGGVAALLLVGAVVVATVFDLTPVPTVDPVTPPVEPVEPVAEQGVLPVPEVGEALPAYLEDGRPVFVSHPDEGEVVVLDAVDPRAPHGWQQLVAYCSTSRWFEELRHASRFNGWGDYTDGPAPDGMADYSAELRDDGEQVQVVGSRQERPGRDAHRDRQQSPQGPACADDVDQPTSAAVMHQPPPDTPAVDATEIPNDRWAWVELVLGGEADDPRVCDADGTCPADAPAIAGVEPGDTGVLVNRTPRRLLARTVNGQVELILPATDLDGPHPAGWWAADGQRLLAMPAPGEVVATHLADETLVFLSHTEDGQLFVLDPTSPSRPTQLVGWCPPAARFVDQEGGQFGPDGGAVQGQGTGALRTLPHEVVEIGETRGVRVSAGEAASRATPDTWERTTIPCDVDELVGHHPAASTHVYEPGLHLSDSEHWRWVRMAIQEVGGDLYLCAGSDQPCGQEGDPNVGAICEPSDTPDDPTDPDQLACRPYLDPIVITPGATATDHPQLMLVRTDDRGRTADIRRPIAQG